MIDHAADLVPVHHRTGIATGVLIALVFPLGWAAGALHGLHTVTRTRVTHQTVTQTYGKPDQSIDGAQINQGLAGLVCDLYRAKKTVVCHP